MKTYSSKDLKIPYNDIIFLRKNNQLSLGIDNYISGKIITNKDYSDYRPSNKGVIAAFHFWFLVSILLFIFTVYLSFSSNWWWFITGIFMMILVQRSNTKGNAENFVEEAFMDKDFYTKLLDLGAWIYQTDEEVAKKYLNKNDQ